LDGGAGGMDNFISTLVFVLPGIMMYFWVQSFGINPVVKHSPMEMGAIAALLWLPVSLTTILVYNSIGSIYGATAIWTLDELKKQTGSISFLAWFTFLSLPISFILSISYTKIIYPIQIFCVNTIRKLLKYAPLSDASTVWESFFVQVNNKRNKGNLPVRIYKMDKPNETCLVGLISNASRPFETERALILERDAELLASHNSYEYETVRTYVDLKSGIAVAELDLSKPKRDD
jgi:hypothetical protein